MTSFTFSLISSYKRQANNWIRKPLPTIGVLILSALINQAMAGSVAIRDLTITDREGDFPVCFNGVGELLPCASLVELPPPPLEPVPLVGFWSGRMIYAPDSPVSETCYEADVLINIIDYFPCQAKIDTITVMRDDGFLDTIQSVSDYLCIDNSFIADGFCPFGECIEFTLRFNDYGYAEGSWSQSNGGCFGTWSILKD